MFTNRRFCCSWAYAPGAAPRPMVMERGYTGHEHLPWFGVVLILIGIRDEAYY